MKSFFSVNAVCALAFLLNIVPRLYVVAQIPKEFIGHWEGTATIANEPMQIVFNLSETRIQYDAPEQGIYAVDIQTFNFSDNIFSFAIPGREPIPVKGKMIDDQMTGEAEGKIPMTFSMQRTSGSPTFYQEEEVTYTSGEVVLSGTLIKPNTEGPHAVIIMIHGSGNVGRMTRDRTRNMAFVFAKSGIATLIYDRRGNGKSTGETDRLLRMELLAKDAAAGATYLSSRNDIIKDKIGFYGLSQGGWVVPYASALFGNTGFVVVVSAAGITPDKQEAFVQEHLAAKNGTPVEAKPVQNSVDKQEEIIPGFSAFDPIPYWSKVKVPVLAVWGEKDPIIPVEKSKQLIGEVLAKGNNENYTLKVFSEANHELKIGNGPLAKMASGSQEFVMTWVRENVLSPKKN